MNIENAVERSISHNEIVACEFDGDYGDLVVFVHETMANGNDAIFSEENDGTVDVDDFDGQWRVRVTLAE